MRIVRSRGMAAAMASTCASMSGPGSRTIVSSMRYVRVPSSVKGPGLGAVIDRMFTAARSFLLLPSHPLLAVGAALFLPDRYRLLDAVDRHAAGCERLGPVRRRADNGDRNGPGSQKPGA